MAHRAQVIDLIRLHFLQDTGQVGAIGQVTVVQVEFRVSGMRILKDMIHALGVKRGGTTFDSVHFVAFFQQKFCQIRTILSGNAGDESDFRHVYFLQTYQKLFSFNAFAYHHCGIATAKLICRKRFKNTAARTNHGAIANGNARRDKNVGRQPAFLTQGDGLRINIKMLTHIIVTAGTQITLL